MIFLRATKEGTLLKICVQPKASRTRVLGLYGEALKIAVQAPPVDGAANEAIVEFLAGLLGLARKSVHLKSGETSRQKTFLLAGIPLEQAKACLEGKLP